MILINLTQKKPLSNRVKKVISLSDKAWGLLKQPGSSLIFSTRWGIHTFFLKDPIDVVITDQKYKIIKIFEHLNPWRVAFWNPKYDIVIELPKGTIVKSGTKVGDQLVLTK
jgi:uncharacterized membrane protein (UPF0127 family)